MPLKLIEAPSPNCDARPEGGVIDMLVLHYTGMKTAEEAVARLCDPASKVSAHYTIGRDGRIWRHVPEEMRAWHAGVSWWAGVKNVNGCSIGIELVNPGHEFGYVPFAEVQIAALIDLAGALVERHRIPKARVLGHSDVAPARKQDPGELFPWKVLSEYGLGIWPEILAHPRDEPAHRRNSAKVERDVERNLRRFGYGIAPDADASLTQVITAFQRHFRPAKIDGIADSECSQLADSLMDRL